MSATPEYCASFSGCEQLLAAFQHPEFQALPARLRFKKVNEALLNLIKAAPVPSYLFPAVVDFIAKINKHKITAETFNFALFEFWLNQFSGVSEDEAFLIRGKIAGKFVPREEYQTYFPIGMNKMFSGTHFVAAHLSPDVDTMIASFWGWIDAFAARVTSGLHIWCLPGGPPNSPVTTIFKEMFGAKVFSVAPRTATTLTLSALDMVTQENFIKEKAMTSISSLDHGFNEKAVILIDEDGSYLGDWRSHDVELVRQIIVLFKSCLHWFETTLHIRLISLFARSDLQRENLLDFLQKIFGLTFRESEPIEDFTDRQKENLHLYLNKVLGLEKGLDSTFSDLAEALDVLKINSLKLFFNKFEELQQTELFTTSGALTQDPAIILHYLEKIVVQLDKVVHIIRNFVERLDIVMAIKAEVLAKTPHYLTLRSDVEDIRGKMKNYDYLTVVIPEKDDKLFPLGIVWSRDLRKPSLGTVSFRDFCNLEEVQMASYLQVISVIDHHKTTLTTPATPQASIGDAQSCNVLIAEKTFVLNDRYSLGGLTPEIIESSYQKTLSSDTPLHLRLQQRLLQRKVALGLDPKWFVHPQRELSEYLCFVYAIIDDTDLLTKVSSRDVECMAQLLNRIVSLQAREEKEIITLDDLPRDHAFAKAAASRILKTPEMYAIYEKIYAFREKEIEKSLTDPHFINELFADVKEQNGCARISQTKLFSSNLGSFNSQKTHLRHYWVNGAKQAAQDRPDIDLHIHMVSTIASAEEVYTNTVGHYQHQDELWFWAPDTQSGDDHLASFLLNFQGAPEIQQNTIQIEWCGPATQTWKEIFSQNFVRPDKSWETQECPVSLVVLHYKAGTLNSRKSMISPYLPKKLG